MATHRGCGYRDGEAELARRGAAHGDIILAVYAGVAAQVTAEKVGTHLTPVDLLRT